MAMQKKHNTVQVSGLEKPGQLTSTFHSLEPEMQERVHNHYKEFGDDWKGQDKKRPYVSL